MTFLIVLQRYVFKYHTILQIIVGGLIGGIFGYFVFCIAQENIKGKINRKKDDNCYIM